MKKWKSELVLAALLLPVLLSILTVAQSPTPADAIALEQQGKIVRSCSSLADSDRTQSA